MFSYDYPRPMVTVDVVAFTRQDDQLFVLLIQRNRKPFLGSWALPGGFLGMEESLESAAARELAEETGLSGISLEQFHTYGDTHRDPRGRVISVAYLALIPAGKLLNLQSGSDANEVSWFPVEELPELAFDHRAIIQQALTRI